MPCESPKMATVGGFPVTDAGRRRGARRDARARRHRRARRGLREIDRGGRTVVDGHRGGRRHPVDELDRDGGDRDRRQTITLAVRSTGQVTSCIRCAGLGLTTK
jgi:hypothetical protein